MVELPEKVSKRWQPRTLYFWLARMGASTTFTIFLLVLLNVICYSSTVDGYFLADDFSHVSYLYQVFHGHPELLLQNFWTNWMQTEGTRFYRPVISITLALDYLLWSGSAKGFHLSNLIFQILSSIGVFLVSKRLFLTDLRGKQKNDGDGGKQLDTRARLKYKLSPDHVYTINFTSLLAASIFAVHPLHPEVVSWIIGRVDSVCTTFYLFSLWLFLISIQTHNDRMAMRARYASLGLFALALGSKEMAVTLPPTLVLLLLFFQTPRYGRAKIIFVRVFNAIRGSWRYWLLLLLYLIIRTASLGTFMGGYQGSIGEGFSSSLIERLLSQRSAYRVMFPLNLEIFAPNSQWFNYLRIVYLTALGSFVLSLLISRSKETIIKSVLFTGLWFILIMIPAIPVWNLTDTLQSSRFIYMGTVPISILLAIIICPLSRYGRRRHRNREKADFSLRATQDFLKGVSASLAVLLIIAFTFITTQNNSSWARASKEVKELRAQLAETVEVLPPGEKIALLNTPDRYKGAHMIYNGAQIQVLMEPPLTPFHGEDRVITFEPAMYGESDLVRASRLRQLLKNKSPALPVYKWDRRALNLVKLNLKDEVSIVDFKRQDLTDLKIPGNNLLMSPYINTAALSTDFVELTCKKESDAAAEIPVCIYWTSPSKAGLDPEKQLTVILKDFDKDGKTRVRLNPTEHKKWIDSIAIGRLALTDPSASSITLESLRLFSGEKMIPVLAACAVSDNRGIVNLGPEEKSLGITYDTSQVSGAVSAMVEISKPNSWFEHYTGTFRDDSPSEKALTKITLPSLKSTDQKIDLTSLKESGFYQLRIAAIDKEGAMTGYFSDPIVLQVTR
ncbi:MAG: hypothetical protein R3F51_10340 [Cyanobacteriota/Melainabacteria group bacterium]